VDHQTDLGWIVIQNSHRLIAHLGVGLYLFYEHGAGVTGTDNDNPYSADISERIIKGREKVFSRTDYEITAADKAERQQPVDSKYRTRDLNVSGKKQDDQEQERGKRDAPEKPKHFMQASVLPELVIKAEEIEYRDFCRNDDRKYR